MTYHISNIEKWRKEIEENQKDIDEINKEQKTAETGTYKSIDDRKFRDELIKDNKELQELIDTHNN